MRGSRGRAWPVRLAALLLVVTQAVAFAAPAAAETSPDFDPALAAKLQAILDRVRIERPIAGLAAVVTLADGSRWEGGSGFGDAFDGSQLFSAHTPSVAGSITKTFVAALILQLVEEGKLHLDDRLDDWVPEKGFSPRVRIKHLLRHTSGIPDYFRHPDYNRLVFNRPTHVWSKAEVMSLIKTTLRFTPGHSWSYSNSGFFLLGLIAERATHSTLGALLRQRFFVPLGLDETWLQGEHTLPANSAKGYLWVNGRFKEYADGTSFRPHTSAATVAWGAGNILTTASDLSDWVRALYGGDVLAPSSLTRMVTFNSSGYGFGTTLRDADGQRAWGHNGSLRGFTAVAWYLPDLDATVTLMTNRGRIQPDGITRELASTVANWEPTPPPTPSPTPPTPSPSASPTSEVTPSPSPTPEPTPSPTPEPTPSPMPEPTPSPTEVVPAP